MLRSLRHEELEMAGYSCKNREPYSIISGSKDDGQIIWNHNGKYSMFSQHIGKRWLICHHFCHVDSHM